MKAFWGKSKGFLSTHWVAIMVEVLVVVAILSVIMALWCDCYRNSMERVKESVKDSYEKVVKEFNEFEQAIELGDKLENEDM